MKGKIVLVFTAIVILTLAFAPLVKALPTLTLYGYTDKIQYKPGETGTVKFWIYNSGPEDIILKNVTIYYPWYSPIWGGNQTIIIPDIGLSKDKNYSNTDTFTVPNDARAKAGTIDFIFAFSYGGTTYTRSGFVPIDVATAPSYGSLQDMDKLVTLFTVQVVLLIVCTVIIAATIFLSGRRPQVTWRKEEKVE